MTDIQWGTEPDMIPFTLEKILIEAPSRLTGTWTVTAVVDAAIDLDDEIEEEIDDMVAQVLADEVLDVQREMIQPQQIQFEKPQDIIYEYALELSATHDQAGIADVIDRFIQAISGWLDQPAQAAVQEEPVTEPIGMLFTIKPRYKPSILVVDSYPQTLVGPNTDDLI